MKFSNVQNLSIFWKLDIGNWELYILFLLFYRVLYCLQNLFVAEFAEHFI